jgi:mRNA interferase MazF
MADFGEPQGSRPAQVRPFVVLQADFVNRTRISTVIGVAMTSNLALAEAPGNVVLEPHQSGLPQPSVVNVTQLATLAKGDLLEHRHHLSESSMAAIEAGLKLVMGLS